MYIPLRYELRYEHFSIQCYLIIYNSPFFIIARSPRNYLLFFPDFSIFLGFFLFHPLSLTYRTARTYRYAIKPTYIVYPGYMETMDKKIKHARVRGYGFNGIDGKKFNNDTNWQEGIGYIQRQRAGAPPRRLDHKAFPSLFSPSFSSFLCV